ncbi:MAG: hypothetical protein AAB270_03815 [Chloroflexota bacterium]
MPSKRKPEQPCALCGRVHENPSERLAHFLVGHGPLNTGATPRKRHRARAALPKIHRRLEEMGFDEVQAHRILAAVAEELRKMGAL